MLGRQFPYVCAVPRWLAAREARRRAMRVMLSFVTVPVLIGLSSCAAHRIATLGDPALSDATQAHRVAIAGYTMSDGHYHPFDGYVFQTADSLIFVRPPTRPRFTAAGSPEMVLRLPRQQVQSITLERFSVSRTVLFSASMFTLLALAALSGGVTP